MPGGRNSQLRWSRALIVGIALGLLAGCSGNGGASTAGEAPEPDRATATSPAQAMRDVEVYFLAQPSSSEGRRSPQKLSARTVSTVDTGDAAFDAVRALFTSDPEGPGWSNGFNYFVTIEPSPITTLLSVDVAAGVITVDVSRDVSDPYPAVDCACPSGSIVMRQLVWTVQSALGSRDPVALTVNGEPARMIWGTRLNGPVQADPDVITPVRQSSG